MSETKVTGLALLREPFPPHQISKLPKPTKKQTDDVKADYKKGVRCQICGTWHHPDAVHLDYVGHAALTDRLLDADPGWTWEPLAMRSDGLPAMDPIGGMWIKLTVCGVTRIGYGDAQGKDGPNAIKECIGDALRNAAMRFGAALDLWHKGDLHLDDEDTKPETRPETKPETKPEQKPAAANGAKPASNEPDMSPKARAQRIMTGVAAGDAVGAAQVLSREPDPVLNAIWALLDERSQEALTAAWPKAA